MPENPGPTPEGGTPDYTPGFGEEYTTFQLQLQAADTSAWLLEQLRPGHRVLDMGCGPGSITLGLAQAVAPGGQAVGVDMEESQLAIAKELAERHGVSNLVLTQGDIISMDLPEERYDAVHLHRVLTHVPDTSAVLYQAKRTLRPGGLLFCRDMITGECFTEPGSLGLNKAWRMYEGLVGWNDGHPNIGRQLKETLQSAGFGDVVTRATFRTYQTQEEVKAIHRMAKSWLLSEEISQDAISYGAIRPLDRTRIAEAYDRWLQHPGAWMAQAYGEAMGRKPE